MTMNYDEFLKQKEQVDSLSAAEQKAFYAQFWENRKVKTTVRVYASFCYGQLFYQEGDFEKVIEIIEPIVVDYHSYPYTSKMLSCFNLIGVATHCEAEYRVSRFYYQTALQLAKENGERFYDAFEYNNIALTYLAEEQYTEALKSLELAEAALKDCDEEMGAYIYVNKSIALQKLHRLNEALEAFELGVKTYHADEIVPDDVLRCATTLSYQLGHMQDYEQHKQQILSKINEMHAAEFIDVCRELFACGLDAKDDALMTTILQSMHRYMEKYPDEIKVGLVFSELEYAYAVNKADQNAVLAALEKKCDYQKQIIDYAIEKRVKSLAQHIEINSQISDLELDALTGFKNRKAYYKDIDFMEHDKTIRMQPVGVVFADVNGLKEVNDCFGHEAGDELITTAAKALAAVFPEARKYRFGGDEFVLLSFDKTKEAFDAKLEKLSSAWKDTYSVSIGSVWQEYAKNFEKGVAVADEMMYTDKRRYYKHQGHDRRRPRTPVDTEEALKKMAAVANLLPGGFFIYYADADEQLITVNQELLNIYKCQTQEEFAALTGNSFRGMVHPDDLNIVERNISSQIKHEKDIDRVQYRIRCKDGTIKMVVDYGRFVHTERYGNVYYVFMNELNG